MAFGLKSCLPIDGDYQTFRVGRGSPVPWRLDYIFVSERTDVSTCRVLDDARSRLLSDHDPVIADLSRAWRPARRIRPGSEPPGPL